MEFSKEIIKKYQAYMLKQHDVSISDDQAQLDLDSLGSLYLLFSKTD